MRQGTKGRLRGWLGRVKNLTHSAYSKLPVEMKLLIQEEYKGGSVKKAELAA